MAERRMFAKSVVESDQFLELSHSAQALYIHLGLNADDEGFVQAPRRISKMCDCKPQDLAELSKAGFIIQFESGVLVITDWKRNNTIQADRRHDTLCTQEKSMLREDSKRYSLIAEPLPDTDTICIRTVSKSYPENSIDKNRLVEVSASLGEGAGGTLYNRANNSEDETERLKKEFLKRRDSEH